MQALLDRWYAAVRSNDAAALASITTDDVVLYWNADPAVIPWGGRHEGRDAVLAFFKTLSEHIEVVNVTVVDRIDAPAATIIVLDGQWRTRDSGQEISARACNVFRTRDGKISAYEVYNDSGRFADALRTHRA
jgi:uncharacterized protein